MRKDAIKKLIGREHWCQFIRWMCGQTVSRYEDGETDYYEHDVIAFKDKLDTGYDRQEDPKAWD